MRALIAAVVLFAAALAPSLAHAQQQQCRTSPVGASSAYCASEAFVTQTGALPLSSATVQASGGSPAGTASATPVMMGLGTACKLTPVYSGRIKLEIKGSASNTVSLAVDVVQALIGTGVAPANGAAVSGTAVGPPATIAAAGASNYLNFSAGGIVSGLTLGTAYWFDASLSVTGGTGTILFVGCNAFEF